MTYEHPFDPATCADPAEWPRCPRCGSRELLADPFHFRCLQCPETGASDALTGAVTRHALARMALEHHHVTGPVQFGPFPQSADPELGHALHARRVEAFVDDVAHRQSFNVGNGVAFDSLYAPPRTVDLSTLDQPARLKHPDVLLFRSATDVLHVESFGTPPVSFRLNRNFPEFIHSPSGNAVPLLPQPLDWSLLHHDSSPHAAIRYVAGLEGRGATNVTLSVLEDMDSAAVHARLSMRTPGEATGTVKEFPFDDADAAVAAMSKKFGRLRGAVEPEALVFSFERQFGLERNPVGIVGELETLEMWDVYRKERL